MATTSIEWTDVTWNPIRGCSVISPGCVNCYAMKQAHRFSGVGRPYEGLTKQTSAGPQWTGKVMLAENHLIDPLKWRAPKRVFVNSMADLFHEAVPFESIDRIFGVMAASRYIGIQGCVFDGHTFQVLTKRAERMREYLSIDRRQQWAKAAATLGGGKDPDGIYDQTLYGPQALPNVWLGVSVENQKYADERIPLLLQTPAAVRFLSCEPLLEGLDISKHRPGARGLGWVIVGGESGPGARPCQIWWIRNIVGQCRDADVPVFVKQLGADVRERNDADFDGSSHRAWPVAIERREAVEDNPNGFREEWQGAEVRIRLIDRKGGDMAEWPEDLRVRQFPEARA